MNERCGWCGSEPDYVAYHDTEWGVPETDPRALWEKLILDGFQAGLSWITILRKRDNFRARFDNFDPTRIARWGEPEIAAALTDAGIIRHRGKIETTVTNARAFLEIEANQGFTPFLWDFVGGAPRQNRPKTLADIPTQTAESRAMSKALKAHGFKFCGPTIVYAFMQATGMVNDHILSCPCQAPVEALAQGFTLPG